MPSKKEKNQRLAREAFANIFEGSRVEGRAPDILKPQPAAPPMEPQRHPGQPTPASRLLPLRGFLHPARGHSTTVPKQFKAILARESRVLALVVYEIIEQPVGREDPNEPYGRREWAKLSLQHFQRECAMSRSQVQSVLQQALNRGYIRRRGVMDEYEYTIRWLEEKKQTRQPITQPHF